MEDRGKCLGSERPVTRELVGEEREREVLGSDNGSRWTSSKCSNVPSWSIVIVLREGAKRGRVSERENEVFGRRGTGRSARREGRGRRIRVIDPIAKLILC